MSSWSRILQTGANQVTWDYGNGHNGIDIVKQWSEFDGLIAHSDGIVVAVRNNCTGFEEGGSYGNYVKIDHGSNYSTLYAHMASVAVSVGQKVSKGQYIGYMGNTGYCFGGHVHFEVWYKGSRINPTPYINANLPLYNGPVVDYLAYDLTKKQWLPIVSSGKSAADTAGNKRNPMGCLAIHSATLKKYCVKDLGAKNFLPTVNGFNVNDFNNGFAGDYKKIVSVAIDDPSVKYRVKLGETQIWLPTVYGKNYNLNDFKNGYAGDDKNWIDEIEIWMA